MPTISRVLVCSLLSASAFGAEVPIPDRVAYNRDVRPILADNCFRCHGFDKNTREADLRLDVREAAVASREGIPAIVPGQVEKSELWQRINTKDEEDVMPPLKAHRQLSVRDKAVLKKWIEQGAEYQPHWAYLPPAKPALPAVQEPGFSRNPIDAFVLTRQREAGVRHAPEADRVTLARRVSQDLLGLPPSPEEIAAFVQDPSSDAYEQYVDRLLASPRFGERMAVWWLDLVRYADTIGYHSDNARNVWPYRDYVIRAFNQNMPFDRFTIEQVAGDLLPQATIETRVASGYNRLILTTEEGGAQPKQYEAKYVTDRVKSIGTTWLAQTFMCAECHDHKYDPVTARDFYALGAFFADIKEGSVGKREDGMLIPTAEQEPKLKEMDARVAALQAKLNMATPELTEAQQEWEMKNANGVPDVAWTALKPAEIAGQSLLKLREDLTVKVEVEGSAAADDYRLKVTLPAGTTGLRLEALPSQTLPGGGPGRSGSGNFVLSEFIVENEGKLLKLAKATATYEQAGFPAAEAIDGKPKGKENGWAIGGATGRDSALYVELAQTLEKETTVVVILKQNYGDDHTLGKFRLSATIAAKPIRAPNKALPEDVLAALKLPLDQRKPEHTQRLAEYYRGIAPLLEPVRAELAAEQKARTEFTKNMPRCLVSEAASPRVVRVLPRGDWMNETGEEVTPATPHFLPGAPQPRLVEGKPQRLTRLDLAQWLVSRENPLTARVLVNRLWKQFYGGGISKTLEDIGTQSELPTLQPLLDWMAVELMDRQWNVKALIRLMVTSGTYRQSSVASPELLARDPMNREFARQGRWRLDAEFIRDNALSVAGLLVEQLGGPSVKPYQPAGYWENLNFPMREWQNDTGSNQWRRGLYTWWQRSYVHPAMLAFDAPTREECSADRVRSSIPQQALVLLNDPEYVESARALAQRMIQEGGETPTARLAWAWRRATGRAPQEAELHVLQTLLEKHQAQYRGDSKAVEAVLKVGLTPVPKEVPTEELAAYTSVARAILNLHETVSRL